IGMFLESLVIGLLARVYARRLSPHDHPVEPGGLGVGQWLKLAAVWLGIYLLVSAVTYLSYDMFSDWLSGSPRRIAAFEFGLFALAHVLLAPFALAMPLLGIAEQGKASLGFALGESLRIFGRHPLLTFVLVLIPAALLTYPLIWAYSPGAGLIYKLKPEVTLYLLLALAIANSLVALLYTGTVTRLALEERRGD
ncbi:MAG TPA: hypothetical protein VLB27_07955, partial [candidate division Zixibacteria bacterium]|nr:hypothetical protein [candidate division Zixibacteria bacterium]